jgi:nucleolar protein 53
MMRNEEGVAIGMKVAIVEDREGADVAEDEEDGEETVVKKATKPKTKKQRRKALALLAEVSDSSSITLSSSRHSDHLQKRARAAQAAKKKQLESITTKSLRSLKQSLSTTTSSAHSKTAKRPDLPLQQASENPTKKVKLGKHTVPTERLDVQLGEELSESLRELQPEGSLFRDRFVSMQQRALIEPRVRVM